MRRTTELFLNRSTTSLRLAVELTRWIRLSLNNFKVGAEI